MKKGILIVFLSVFLVSFAEEKSINTSDIRVEISSQIKRLKEEKSVLLKKIRKASKEEKKHIKEVMKKIDDKIIRLQKLLKNYLSFTGSMG